MQAQHETDTELTEVAAQEKATAGKSLKEAERAAASADDNAAVARHGLDQVDKLVCMHLMAM